MFIRLPDNRRPKEDGSPIQPTIQKRILASLLLYGLTSFAGNAQSNLITNPGFESKLSSWTTSGTTAADTANPHSGAYAFKSTTNGKVTQLITGINSSSAYTLSGWAKTTSASQRCYVRAVCLNGSGTQIGTSDTLQFTSTSYAQLITTFTPPSGTAKVRVEAWKTAGTGYFDDLSLSTSNGGCTSLPSVPTGLASSNIASSSCVLTWNASTVGTGCTISGYKVYKNGTLVASPTTNSATITGLSANTTYSFSVEAVDAYGASGTGTPLLVKTNPPSSCTAPPSVPSGLTPSATQHSVTLTWSASSVGSACTLAGYRVYQGGTLVASPTTISATISGLTVGTAYTFGVSAITSNNLESNQASVTVRTSNPDPSAYINHAYHDANRYNPSNKNIADTVNALKQYAIKYQFIDLGQVDDAGNLEGDIQPYLANYISVSKATDPDQKIVAVVNCEWRDIVLDSSSVQANLRSQIQTLCSTYAIDGVHLDIEPISLDVPNDQRYINFVKTLKPVMSGKELSVTGVCWSDVWSNAYITQMASYVDMINIMLYDTNGPSTWEPYITHNATEYTALWKDTVIRYSTAIAASTNPNCMFAPTMPSYSKRIDKRSGVPYHDPAIENIMTAATGLNQAISAGAKVYGSGIFWWGSFISTNPDTYGHTYDVDRGYWTTYWMNQ